MTNFEEPLKKIERINDRLVEFDILKKMDNPPGSFYFSDNFRNYYQALQEGEILLPCEEHPEDISKDDLPSIEEQMMIDMVMFYLIRVKQTPLEILNSFKAEDYVEFVNAIKTLFRLDDVVKEIEQINDRLIELDVFKRMDNPPGSIHFSDNFRDFFNKLLRSKIQSEYKKNPDMTDIDSDLIKQESIPSLLVVYFENVKKMSKEEVDAITDKEWGEFAEGVGAIFVLDKERKVGYRK